jgi:hypothetical protein
MLSLSRALGLLMLIAYSGAAFAQVGDALRRARQQIDSARNAIEETRQTGQAVANDATAIGQAAGAIVGAATPSQEASRTAQECAARASTDPRFSSCAQMCNQIAASLANPAMTPATSTPLLKICTDSYSAATGVTSQPPNQPPPAAAGANQAAAPALPATPVAAAPAATTDASSGRRASGLEGYVSVAKRNLQQCGAFAPSSERTQCVAECTRAIGRFEAEAVTPQTVIAAEACSTGYAEASRRDVVASLPRVVAECRLAGGPAGPTCVTRCESLQRVLAQTADVSRIMIDNCLGAYNTVTGR